MSRQPLNFLTSHLIRSNKMPSLPDMLTTFGQFLHSFNLSELFLHIFSESSRYSKSVMTHGSPPNWFRKCLMSCFLGVHLKIYQKLCNLNRSILNELVEIDVPRFIFHIYIAKYLQRVDSNKKLISFLNWKIEINLNHQYIVQH